MNDNINEETINKKSNRNFRNSALVIVGLMIILGVIAGGTYAYFAFNTSNSTTINGTSAADSISNSNLSLTVSKLSTQATGALVPQLTSAVNKAIVGTSSKKCVDGNGNTVCQIYKITASNASSTAFGYNVYIKFAYTGAYTNLKYAVIPVSATTATVATSVTVGTAMSATTSNQSLGTGSLAATSGTADYYIVVWINETNTTQNSIDRGTFTGTVSLTDTAGNSYITSTFT